MPVSIGCPVSSTFDVFGPEFQADPAAALAEARRECPVFYSEANDHYIVTRHEDIRAVFTNSGAISSRNTIEPFVPLRPRAAQVLEENGFTPIEGFGTLDDPLHMKRRKAISAPFLAENVAALEPRVREVVSEYIDRFVQRGRADLVAEIFYEAPAVIALAFLGLSPDEIAQAKDYGNGVTTFIFGRPTGAEQVAVCEKLCANQQFAHELIDRLWDDPAGDGLLAYAVRVAQANPGLFTRASLEALAITTLTAAHETTTATQTIAMMALLQHRESWDAICADPALIPGAIEEIMRHRAPLAVFRRLCTKELELGGATIPAGARVLVVMASGNHDDALFSDPETLDIERANARRHLSFGFGSHHCLGAPLARLQIRIALEELSRRLPHLRLVDGQSFEHPLSAVRGGPQALLVEWDASQNPVVTDRP